ncbi:hypothetical protein METBIDRAFT_69644 [Metschnikowia bicuspidata var. bicuspidata NRRL YB-4993]|uniref:PWWP domain-containing protein n=1 Tax=Metschnikowia bicuspidata var. bicuspidata NRRL YB-4993 TaxID=869754 RepID=A0A1A0HB78_9ASCO|nr:hypothetical protein METBIDRAFT_69644 [Metschnikowia bicuspidata var. bicuspidata NRRL YB-4993]OBA21266.1 hypothetical protein METBIDRAFT_69644 [Metschnikowia bicuspidata var. bicuspidata NRRL YB-4993]
MAPKPDKRPLFQPKDMVLAKMTGFPAWPSFVMPPDMVPEAILKAKKKTTNTCVIFIPDGDFNWMNEKSLEVLSPEKLRAKIDKIPKDKLKTKAKKKSARTSNVVEALVAASGLQFDAFMADLASAKAALDDGPDGADDGGRVSEEALPDADVLAEDADNSEGQKDETALDGHENGAHDDGAHDDGAHEDDANNDGAPKDGASKDGPHKDGLPAARDKAAVSEQPAPKKRAGSPRTKAMSESDRQHQLWLCRIKLQRSLIQRNQPVTPKDPKSFPPPSVDELLMARIILQKLADFPVTVDLLRDTKIHKVLKCIVKDGDLEYPDSFRLHEKCTELLEKWLCLIEGIKLGKAVKTESRVGSSAPEDSEISAIELKHTLDKSDAGKIGA